MIRPSAGRVLLLPVQKRERADRQLLLMILEACAGHPFGARVPSSATRDRLRKEGLIVHRYASGKAGNPHRWFLTPKGAVLANQIAGAQP